MGLDGIQEPTDATKSGKREVFEEKERDFVGSVSEPMREMSPAGSSWLLFSHVFPFSGSQSVKDRKGRP